MDYGISFPVYLFSYKSFYSIKQMIRIHLYEVTSERLKNQIDFLSVIGLPKFLDVHSFHSLGEATVKELQKSPLMNLE
jgi:hypothetical protein